MTAETDVTARLATALRRSLLVTAGTAPDIAAALLPVVRELGDLRAAEELEAAAARSHDAWTEADCLARAAALRGEAGR